MPDNPSPDRKPADHEIDAWGVTHTGKVRTENQDHFLLGSVHKRVQLQLTSLPDAQRARFGDERLAVVAMVADGVGGGVGGAEASAIALEAAMEYVTSSTTCFLSLTEKDGHPIEALQAAAMRAHEAVHERRARLGYDHTMATTLTVFLGLWPAYYVLQVGDSRYYLYRDGALRQLTRDQTIAQDLVDDGVMSRTQALQTQFASVLSSAVGGESAMPVVTRLQADWGNVHLLCSDGLTKHVTDEQIAARLGAMTSARQACELLLQDALDGGGTDNITIIVGRLVPGLPP
jgi:serine/threonine protein phosphatase PrpC